MESQRSSAFAQKQVYLQYANGGTMFNASQQQPSLQAIFKNQQVREKTITPSNMQMYNNNNATTTSTIVKPHNPNLQQPLNLHQFSKKTQQNNVGYHSQNFMSGGSMREQPTASHRTTNEPLNRISNKQSFSESPPVEKHNLLPQKMSNAPVKGQHRQHSDTQHFDHFYKIILTGDAGVGKSNYLLRYVRGIFENAPATIGVEFAYKVSHLKNGTKIKSQIWDTSGSEKYRSITTGHYRFALGAVLVYDVTNAESFKSCRYWVDQIRQYADENVVIALVGNKSDSATLATYKRKVTLNDAKKFAEENNLIFVGESSAQMNANVTEVFDALYEKIATVQQELIEKGLKKPETLKISEEEVMLNNHRCCY